MAREETKIVLGAVDNVTPTLNRIGKELGSLNKAFGALAGGALVGLTAVIARTVQSLDQLGDTARSLNITTESLSGLGFAAQQSGSSAEALERGLTRLNKVIGEAASGNKAAADLFDRLGISVRDVSGDVISVDKAFLAIAERFRLYKDGAEEAALNSELFGLGLAELIPLLNEGEAGILGLKDEAKRLGAVIGTDTVAAAQQLNDNLDKLKAVGTGLAVEVTNVVLPALNALAEALLNVRQFGEAATGALDVGFGGQAKDVIEALSLQISRAEADLQALREAYAFVDEVPEDIQKQVQALSNFINNTERTLARLREAQKKTGESAKVAAKDTGTLAPPVVETGKAAEGAAPKVDKFRQSIERLRDPSRQFYDSLEITRTAMQDLVQDIDVGAVSFDNLGDSLATMSATATEEAQLFQDNWQGAVGAVQDAFADFIAGNIKSFEDFGDALESIARQFLANLVRQFLSTNLSFGNINLGGLFGGGNNSPGGGAGGLGSFGSVLGIGAIIAGLASIFDRQKPPSINVIGDNVVGTRGFRNFAPGSTFESRLGGFTFASIDSVDRQTRDQIGQSVVNFDNTIADLLNDEQLDKVTAALANFNIRLRDGAISAENILGERFDAILSTFDQDVQDFVNGAATLEERTQRLAEVLSRPQRLNALIDSLEEVDRLSGLTPFERELDAINKQFDAAAEEARKLGADQAQLARIEELRGNAIERLNDLQRANLDALLDDLRFDDLTEGLSDTDREVAAINRRFDALRQQAIDLGATQADLELIERRRTAALRQATQATVESTEAIDDFYDMIADSRRIGMEFERDFLDSLNDALEGVRNFLNGGASVSSLNPLQRLQQSQGQFEEIVRQISGGSFDAIRAFPGGANAFLQQAAGFYGVGSAEFQAIERAVLGTARGLANVDTGQSVAGALNGLRPLFQLMIDLLRNNGALTAAQTQQVTAALSRLAAQPARAL